MALSDVTRLKELRCKLARWDWCYLKPSMEDLQFTSNDGHRTNHESITAPEKKDVLAAIAKAESIARSGPRWTWQGSVAAAMKGIVLSRLDEAILSAAEDARKEALGVLDLLDAEESDADN